MSEVPAQSVLDHTRAYLNDTPGNQWTNSLLLPYLRLAWDELNIELQSRDIQVMMETTVVLPVAKDLNVLPAPDDLITPFHLMERASGGHDSDFVMMSPATWEPAGDYAVGIVDETSRTNLGSWAWRGQQFHFPKHSADVEVLIHYLKQMSDVEDETQLLQISNCRVVLSKRTAGLAARYGNSNPSRADLLDQEAAYFMQKLTGIEVKTKQAHQGTRRRGWGSSRRYAMR